MDIQELATSPRGETSYVPPRVCRVPREGNEKLYKLEAQLHERFRQAAALEAVAMGLGLDFFREQLPQALYSWLDGWDSRAATLAAFFYLTNRHGFVILSQVEADAARRLVTDLVDENAKLVAAGELVREAWSEATLTLGPDASAIPDPLLALECLWTALQPAMERAEDEAAEVLARRERPGTGAP